MSEYDCKKKEKNQNYPKANIPIFDFDCFERIFLIKKSPFPGFLKLCINYVPICVTFFIYF
jgi:hypothetical protein